MSEKVQGYGKAREDFRGLHRHTTFKRALSRLSGDDPETLLSYEEVRQKLKLKSQTSRGLQDIPLDAIVGSVGRYRDFTRDFLPLSDNMEERWARVKTVATSGSGWPPIEVYQVGEVYFVLDGNHRVSVARELELTHISAYVTEVKTKVPLSADVTPDDLIIKEQYAAFLERTRLDESYPQVDLNVTAPGAYRLLDEQIAWQQYLYHEEKQEEISYSQAAAMWLEREYIPVEQVIRERGLLRDFPKRTETDLYVWLVRYREDLQLALQWEVSSEAAADDLVAKFGHAPEKRLPKLGKKVRNLIMPDEFEPGPPPGLWRITRQFNGRDDKRLFRELLVPVSGEEAGWCGLEQAIVVAQREGSQLRGLHISPSLGDRADAEAEAVRERFDQICWEAGVNGRLILESGSVAHTICDRARWNDLVVLNMLYPPAPKPVKRLGSGLRQIIQQCPRPILVAPRTTSQLGKALLAYDGWPKSEEALFLATYLAQRWQISLVILTVGEKGADTLAIAERARRYLAEHNVQAEILMEEGSAAKIILAAAGSHNCDFLIMGGYGAKPIVEAFLGSTANHILRETVWPIFVCQ